MKLLFKDSDIFFEKEKPSLKRDAVQALLLIIMFSAMTAITFYAGWVEFSFSYGTAEAMAWITASSATGFIAVTALLSLIAFRRLDRKSLRAALFLMAYAATPVMLLGWVPNGPVKIAGILWSVVFLKVGLETHSKKTGKEALLAAFLTGGAAIALAALTEFYLIYYI